MPELKQTTCKTLKETLANYSLLEIMEHEVGNGLAVITGYTQLLQRMACLSEQQHHEKYEIYLQAIKQREVQLHNFLTQIRVLALQSPDVRFCQTLTTVDLIPLLRQTIDQLVPLYQHKAIQIRIPAPPFYIACDPPWIELVLEHLLNHNIAFHRGSSPIHVDLESHEISSHLYEAQIGVHILKHRIKRKPVKKEDIFGIWSQTLNQRDQDVCMALCGEILQEHGGRIWFEQGQGQTYSMYVALPLAGRGVNCQ